MNGKHCPICNKDIGVLAIMKAALPSRIACPHCKSGLVYKPFPWLLASMCLVIYLALLLLIILLYQPVFFIDHPLALLIQIGFALLLWIPFELFLAKVLRSQSALSAK